MKHFSGIVLEGSRRARTLGYPTLNIAVRDGMLSGVFVGETKIGGASYPSAIFADPARGLLESHVLNFNENAYGTEITISILEKIRDTENFPNDEMLREAINGDVLAVEKFFAAH